MTRLRYLWLAVLLPLASNAAEPGSELSFEIPTLPGYQRYVRLFEHPGYLAVLLENNDLPLTHSSKLIVRERGREVEAKNIVIRFIGRNGTSYNYEAGVTLGIGSASVTVPVVADFSGLAAGKTTVVARLPLATLIPGEKRERIQSKVRTFANAATQQKLLDYLDRLSKTVPGAGFDGLGEAILLDAYNRGGGPALRGDVGDAVPLSEQWMLILTLAIWFILFPIALIVYRLRRPGAGPA
jgi:hypothetical protein